MRGIAWTTGLTLTTLGVASTAALDAAIDRSGHDRDSWAFRNGRLPTRMLAATTVGLNAASLGALLVPSTRRHAPALARMARGATGAWFATEGARYATGMLFSPRGRGMRFAPDDLARNAFDRIHMMGGTPRAHERMVLGLISRLQGHGSYESRLAAGELMPAP